MLGHGSAKAASGALDAAYEISCLLDTGLTREELDILLALIENGVNPEARCGPAPDIHAAAPRPLTAHAPQALAMVVRELRREAAVLRAAGGGAARR